MTRLSYRLLAVFVVVLATCVLTANASDQTADHYVCITERVAIPPYPYTAVIGRGDFALSPTNELSFRLYDCYFYGQQVVAHIHGPAVGGATGPIIFTLPPGPTGPGYFWTGVLGTLNNDQLHDLNCALWYLDYHTPEYPDGIARGQVRGLWGDGWHPPDPCFLPTEPSTWGSVKSLYR